MRLWGIAMAKAKIYGMNKPFIPNSKADQKRNKPFTGAQKKGKIENDTARSYTANKNAQ